MLNHNIYNIDWDKLIQWHIPTHIRKRKHWEWLRVLLFPLISLNVRFNEFRERIFYSVSLSPQTIQLERMLNDTFDANQRRIYIRKGERLRGKYLFEYTVEANYLNDYTDPNYLVGYYEFNSPIDVHFYIIVSIGLVYNVELMKSLTNKYKALGFTYRILEE